MFCFLSFGLKTNKEVWLGSSFQHELHYQGDHLPKNIQLQDWKLQIQASWGEWGGGILPLSVLVLYQALFLRGVGFQTPRPLNPFQLISSLLRTWGPKLDTQFQRVQ